MNDARTDFILHSREQLALFESALLELEHSSTGAPTQALIEQSLRALHSLKGDSGFLGLTTMRNLAHAMESVLEKFRDGSQSLVDTIIETLLASRDRLIAMLDDLEFCGQIKVEDLHLRLNTILSHSTTSASALITTQDLNAFAAEHKGLVNGCRTLQASSNVTAFEFIAPNPPIPLDALDWPGTNQWQLRIQHPTPTPTPNSLQPLQIDLLQWQQDNNSTSLVDLFRKIERECRPQDAVLNFEPGSLDEGLPTSSIVWQAMGLPLELSNAASSGTVQGESVSVPEPTALAEGITSPPSFQFANPIPSPATSENSHQKQTEKVAATPDAERLRSLRINVELLDRLMNLTGELTLIRNQAQVAFADQEGEARNIIQRLNSVTTELQDTVLQTRMQPVGNLFGRFPRMVRDLARQLGKEVEVVMVGQEVELDKTVLERLSDPLTHLIRNSIDHGIELPAAREAAGKPRGGKITLSATPADGQVFIEIRDDGKGIDLQAVRAKAISQQLRTEVELDRMSSRELCSLILLPGFSTAKTVTDVSGRGVGMDVVKTNVEELEGSLTIDSSLGNGTSMQLRVPLTLAIVPCLIVTVNSARFAVPQRELEEVVCLHPGSKWTLEQAMDTEVFRLRDKLLPVVRFSEVLAHPRPFTATDKVQILSRCPVDQRDPSLIQYILVLRCQGRRFGLLVDEVEGREEIVVKPMHPALRRLTVFAGATLMGDGRAALIANVEGIIEHARCYAVTSDKDDKQVARDPHEVHRVLVFEYGPNEQFAIPLVQIRRVELLDMSSIERVGDHEIITGNGLSTRILRLSDAMNVSACSAASQMYLILPKFVAEPMGILASRIVDTESLAIDLQPSRDTGVLGTAIVHGRHSLFLDIQQLRESLFGKRSATQSKETNILASDTRPQLADENWVVDENRGPPNAISSPYRVLLVDDTPFFREVVKRYLEDDSTQVVTAVDGNDGLRVLATEEFDLVVSDIEMPGMDGWQFCRTARQQAYHMPFVALTSLSKGQHEQRAKECGFDDYEEKLDHDGLKRKIVWWLQQSRAGRALR